MEKGATLVGQRVVWNCAKGCTAPVWLQYIPRDDTNGIRHKSMILDHYVKCRKCEACLSARRRLWYRRSLVEFERANRTWLCTFTLRPELQMRLQYAADIDCRKRRLETLDSLDEATRFSALCYAAGPVHSRYFRQLRKDGNKLRYVHVAEAHKSGVPHWHALIHETGEPIGKRVLQEAWPHGFTNMKLVVDQRGCGYVSKYLTKQCSQRVRCSIAYGRTPADFALAKAESRPEVL